MLGKGVLELAEELLLEHSRPTAVATGSSSVSDCWGRGSKDPPARRVIQVPSGPAIQEPSEAPLALVRRRGPVSRMSSAEPLPPMVKGVGDLARLALPLETPRLLLRLPSRRDVPDLKRSFRDPRTARAHGAPLHPRAEMENPLRMVTRTLREYHQGEHLSLSVILRGDGGCIGRVGLRGLDWTWRKVESLSYWIDPRYLGPGIRHRGVLVPLPGRVRTAADAPGRLPGPGPEPELTSGYFGSSGSWRRDANVRRSAFGVDAWTWSCSGCFGAS